MLTVEHVTLKFGGLIANNDVTLRVKPHTVTALIGPNGAGKTTMFNCISGVYKPYSGEIKLEGKRIDGLKGYQINKAGIARTYQVINLFRNMTVLENVLVGMHSRLKSSYFKDIFRTPDMRREEKEAKERAYDWLEFVGLKDRAMDPAGSLAYGEQRLLEIVRGMASNPKLILLDEPAAGMNSAEKDAFDGILKKILSKGVSILMIEHDMKLVMGVADYVYVLNDGKLLAEGLPAQVQNNPDVITAYIGGDE